MEVFHCEEKANETIPNYVGSCFAQERPDKTKSCKRVVAAWAMGAKAFSYPQVSKNLYLGLIYYYYYTESSAIFLHILCNILAFVYSNFSGLHHCLLAV